MDTGNGSTGPYNAFDTRFTASAYPAALDRRAAAVTKVLAYAGRLGE